MLRPVTFRPALQREIDHRSDLCSSAQVHAHRDMNLNTICYYRDDSTLMWTTALSGEPSYEMLGDQ